MRISQYSYDAPRLLAYLKQIFKARPFRMKRDDWNELKSTFRLNNNGFDELVNTPLSETPNVIGCLVKEIIPNKFEIKLYRFDSKDPKPYNVDVYHVFESITSMENIYYYIKQASTDYDDNMKRVDTEAVIWAKQQPQSDHQLYYCGLPEQLKERAKKYEQELRLKAHSSSQSRSKKRLH